MARHDTPPFPVNLGGRIVHPRRSFRGGVIRCNGIVAHKRFPNRYFTESDREVSKEEARKAGFPVDEVRW